MDHRAFSDPNTKCTNPRGVLHLGTDFTGHFHPWGCRKRWAACVRWTYYPRLPQNVSDMGLEINDFESAREHAVFPSRSIPWPSCGRIGGIPPRRSGRLTSRLAVCVQGARCLVLRYAIGRRWGRDRDPRGFCIARRGAACGFAGLVLLSRAWLAISRQIAAEPEPTTRPLACILALWSGPLLVAPPMFSNDIYSYAAQGELVSHHINPYLYGPGSWVRRHSPRWPRASGSTHLPRTGRCSAASRGRPSTSPAITCSFPLFSCACWRSWAWSSSRPFSRR